MVVFLYVTFYFSFVLLFLLLWKLLNTFFYFSYEFAFIDISDLKTGRIFLSIKLSYQVHSLNYYISPCTYMLYIILFCLEQDVVTVGDIKSVFNSSREMMGQRDCKVNGVSALKG